ncbi:MAG: DUF6622 family protein [Burkholderiales bacterium]
MFLQILERTPPWVFGLFAVLVVLGLMQRRTRELGRLRVSLLPAVFLPLSLFAVGSAFGAAPLAYMGWLAGVAAAVLANRRARWPRQVAYVADTVMFRVAGSWVPLALMMAIFFTRYAVAVTTAIQPALKASLAFAAAVGFAYGALSGAFLARALRILAAVPKQEHRPWPSN